MGSFCRGKAQFAICVLCCCCFWFFLVLGQERDSAESRHGGGIVSPSGVGRGRSPGDLRTLERGEDRQKEERGAHRILSCLTVLVVACPGWWSRRSCNADKTGVIPLLTRLGFWCSYTFCCVYMRHPCFTEPLKWGFSFSILFCHSGPTVLHCEGCSVHCREADQHFCPLSTNRDNKKCHQCLRTLPNSLWGGDGAKSPTFENHCFKIHFTD